MGARIARANLAGFLAGYPDSTFRPQQNLTIAETIESLVNGLQFVGDNPNSLSVYVDRAQIPSFATDEIATATEGKIVVNYPVREKLSLARDITHGEISAFITNLGRNPVLLGRLYIRM
ncbi:S-layer homology domain-containing protein [Microcoleus sp. OTE_8_concoct_300]|uniref:S-layer homology domain-containing protein n=1 Tax=Microcoleus sp. OTE_8_concoct_300 TaxID=2964710 RepID=UPI00403F5E86